MLSAYNKIMTQCPSCKGSGRDIVKGTMTDENGTREMNPVDMGPCKTCNEAGSISIAQKIEHEHQVKEAREIWCSCEKPDNEYYVPDEFDEDGNHVSKHHWNCGICNKLVQIG